VFTVVFTVVFTGIQGVVEAHVSIASDYILDNRGSNPSSGKGFFL
jgi:hypothetical protein